MNRRERILATLRGEPVDRPPVSFYELNGLDEDPDDPDPFNIFRDPSWRPLIELTRAKSDRIVMRGVAFAEKTPDPIEALAQDEVVLRDGRRYTTRTIAAGRRRLTMRTRRDPDVNTVWTEEPLLKTVEDLEAFLELPLPDPGGAPDCQPVLEAEATLGDSGIVMIDTPDPLCLAASLFEMGEFTILAMTEQALFRRLLDRFAEVLYPRTRAVAEALPGRLWRIFGPEYASAPYLPPALFREYVCAYDLELVRTIQSTQGFARLHCHGNIRAILDDIANLGVDALDPIEPPPQGDVELCDVRKRFGDRMVLFGNLEISDLERQPPEAFRAKVRQALDEGTRGPGRGFVLLPSACPYGRYLPPQSLSNYEVMIDEIEALT